MRPRGGAMHAKLEHVLVEFSLNYQIMQSR